MPRLFFLMVLAAACGRAVFGHPGHSESSPSAAQATPQAAPQLPAAMVLPAIDGPRPWSDKPVLNDPDRFQIAIVTDRTGGHRPGVWMDAMRKLNLLRPEFVVSVGDLIEGYTEDEARVEAEWEEFLGFIDKLQMRFFFVAGNHDLTNPMMHRKWRERFGPEWYSFDYKGVHFLCLSSEDPRQQHISQQQIDFVRRDLAANADARWTLVFLHKPLWTYAERAEAEGRKDPTNWRQVEQLLVGRNHTVFAGHVHHYVQYERNGQNYYSLATTGGGSQLRGAEYGEFDHVTWLTMEKDGPHVVNLRLDGILPADTVTEQSALRFSEFLRSATVQVAPILLEQGTGFTEGTLEVRLVNELGRHVEVSGRIEGLPLRGLTLGADPVQLAIDPSGTAQQAVRLSFGEEIPFADLRRATFVAKVVARATDEQPRLSAERRVPVIIDRLYACPRVDRAPMIDGVIKSWPARVYETSENPLVLGDRRQWQGPSDAAVKLSVAYDDEFLYLQASVTDERLIEGRDELRLVIDGRPTPVRAETPQLHQGTYVVSVPAPAEAGKLTPGAGWRREPIAGVEAAGSPTDVGYDIELAVPTEYMKRAADGAWSDFQMSAIVIDADDAEGPLSQIVWRGSPDVESSNINYAHFRRGD